MFWYNLRLRWGADKDRKKYQLQRNQTRKYGDNRLFTHTIVTDRLFTLSYYLNCFIWFFSFKWVFWCCVKSISDLSSEKTWLVLIKVWTAMEVRYETRNRFNNGIFRWEFSIWSFINYCWFKIIMTINVIISILSCIQVEIYIIRFHDRTSWCIRYQSVSDRKHMF